MERGQGPHDMFAKPSSGDITNSIKTGNAAFEKCYGSDKSKWVFNTECCAYSRTSVTCKTGPHPSPAPSLRVPSPASPNVVV